jgi:hypothetical protein
MEKSLEGAFTSTPDHAAGVPRGLHPGIEAGEAAYQGSGIIGVSNFKRNGSEFG